MNPNDLDPGRHLAELRDTLHREAEHFDPIGLGAETVQRRGRRRRNRGRSAIAACSAVCLAAAGVTVLNRGGGAHLAIGTHPGSGSQSAPTLDFRVVNGTVAGAWAHFTTADGLTYELSTAPGSNSANEDPGQAIYATRDGEHWTTTEQPQPWIADLTEGDGVLYAIGTAPGAAADDVKYHLATSHDGGQAWSNSDLPFSVTAPTASVALTQSSSVQVARGPSTTTALLTEEFSPALDSIVAAHFPGRHDVGTRETADGFAMLDFSQCVRLKAGSVAPPSSLSAGVAKVRAKCAQPPVLGTIPWSEIGLSGPGDLVREQVLVSTDGSHWTTGAAPDGVVARELTATPNGFLLLADPDADSDGTKPTGTTAFTSTDATHWTAVSTPPGLNVQAIAGSRIIGTDAAGDIQTSSDAGTSWNATSMSSQLPAGAPAATAGSVDAGPLGFGVLVTADANAEDQSSGHDYLLFSTDGVDWSTTDLAAKGQPAGADPDSVTVGADHVAVDYESVGTAADPVSKLTTLLGTPQR